MRRLVPVLHLLQVHRIPKFLLTIVKILIQPLEVAMITKAVAFVAKSNTGKTTLLEQVIRDLKERGYRIGAIKHDAHSFDIDHPGKDSYRLAAAGADTTLITSPEKLALIKKHVATPPP
jgi:GTPase SAR1 family protein